MNPKLRGRVVKYKGVPIPIVTDGPRVMLPHNSRIVLKDTFDRCGVHMVRVSPVDKPELVTAVYVSEIKFS